jgi:hypothetical protein
MAARARNGTYPVEFPSHAPNRAKQPSPGESQARRLCRTDAGLVRKADRIMINVAGGRLRRGSFLAKYGPAEIGHNLPQGWWESVLKAAAARRENCRKPRAGIC